MAPTQERPKLSFPPDVAHAVCDAYKQNSVILEYGSGGSTVMAAEMEHKHVFSVESDLEWAKSLWEYLKTNPQVRSSVKIHHADIGKTTDWGHPAEPSNSSNFPRYAFGIWRIEGFLQPDLILIDGRFRVASFLASTILLEKNATILFDDYVDRSYYHIVERYVKPTEFIGRMAKFDVSPGIVPLADLGHLMHFFHDFR